MARWSRISSIFIITVTLAAFLLPGTATARYIVEPMTEKYTGEWHDLEEIAFWSLPPRVMIIHFLFMVLPGIPHVGELFYAFSLLLSLGFRRVMRHNVLDDNFRHDLYQQITANPGAGTAELCELMDSSRGRLRYHLDVLIREDKVAAVDYRNRARHFARNKRYTTLEKRIFASLRDETPGAILTLLLRSPGATRNDIAEELGLSGTTILQHMQQFEAEGIVFINRKGRSFRYRLSRGVREILDEHQDLSQPVFEYPDRESYLGA